MPSYGNPYIRVWQEVKDAYKKISEKYGIHMSDLASIAMAYGPILSPVTVALGLVDNFEDIDLDEALAISEELRTEIIEALFGSEEEEEKEKEEEKVAVQA